MLLELGPMAAHDVSHWARFARRMICEVKVDPADLDAVATPDFLMAWQGLVDSWASTAASGDPVFRWIQDVEAEVAEFLIYGFERCVKSDAVQRFATPDERAQHRDVTFAIMRSFTEALAAEGRCHEHLVDQLRSSVGSGLDV